MNEGLETFLLFLIVATLFFLAIWGVPVMYNIIKGALHRNRESKRRSEELDRWIKENTEFMKRAAEALENRKWN